MRWVAYLHPLGMAFVLLLGLAVLREGLAIRRARLRRRVRDRARHVRLASWFAGLAMVGYGSGLASLGWLRGEEILASVHAAFVSGALGSISLAAALGIRLHRAGGSGVLRGVHLACGALGLLLALAGAIAAFELLP